MLFGITHSFPWLFRTPGHITTRYSPFRRCPGSKASFKTLLARLACLIHAANVHSEPESNPSIGICINPRTSREVKEPFEVIEISFTHPAGCEPKSVRSCAGFLGDDYKEPPLKFSKRGHSPNCQRARMYSRFLSPEGKALRRKSARTFSPSREAFDRPFHGRLVILAIG